MLFNSVQVRQVGLVTLYVLYRVLSSDWPVGNQNKKKQYGSRSLKPRAVPKQLKREYSASGEQNRSQIERPENNPVLTNSNQLRRKRHHQAKRQAEENQNRTPDGLSFLVFRPAEEDYSEQCAGDKKNMEYLQPPGIERGKQ